MRHYRETITFPTDICEQDYVSVRIYSDFDDDHAVLSAPDRATVEPERADRIEEIALGLWYQKQGAKNGG